MRVFRRLLDVGLNYDEFISQLGNYLTKMNQSDTFENMWRAQIEMFNIDQDPRFDKDASLKSMKDRNREATEAHLQFKAQQNAKKAAANTLHCPTCGSTNIKNSMSLTVQYLWGSSVSFLIR